MQSVRRLALLLTLVAGLLVVSSAQAALPPIHHVFVIVLENESSSTTFGSSTPAPYLAKTLKAEGAFLPNYYGTGHNSNDNYVAMISGQAPNLSNQEDCQTYSDFSTTAIGSYGQQEGLGCVYPANIPTLAGQLQGKGLTWRDYNEDMGADPSREPSTCGHPALGAVDATQKATAADQYATRHNPFVYFHSIIDNSSLCEASVVNLSLLPNDLARAANTPNYVFITPNLCDDGHDSPCANGRPGGLAQADKFLQTWVPKITSSPAFLNQGGLLMVTFDEAASSDSSSCCGEIAGPGSLLPGLTGPGGGDVGAVLLSPCIAPGTVSMTPYNHYTMLRSVEDIFGLAHIGYAQLPGEQSFGSDIFTRSCGPPPAVRVHTRHLRGRSIRVSWRATGAKVATYFTIQVRTGSGRWRTLLGHTKRTTLKYAARRRRRYRFRVMATEVSGTYSAWTSSARVRG
jgi:hypothetical protein